MVWIVAYSQNSRLQNSENGDKHTGNDQEEQNHDFEVNYTIVTLRYLYNVIIKLV